MLYPAHIIAIEHSFIPSIIGDCTILFLQLKHWIILEFLERSSLFTQPPPLEPEISQYNKSKTSPASGELQQRQNWKWSAGMELTYRWLMAEKKEV